MSREDEIKELIKIHSYRLQKLEEQRATFGDLFVPVHILTQIENEKREIENLQIELEELKAQEAQSTSPEGLSSNEPCDIAEVNVLNFLAAFSRFIIKEASWPWLVLICVIVAPFAGGIVWNLVSKLLGRPEHMGGSGNEPHSFYAFIWGFTTIFPVIFLAFLACSKLLNWNSFPKWFTAFIFYAFFGGLGAVLFYDFGFRNYIESLELGYESQEIIIVALWSCIISVSTYLSFLVLYPIFKELINIRYLFAQIPTAIILSVSAIIFFLLVAEPTSTFDQVRGIAAGFSLRLSLFLGLILSISIGPFIKNSTK